MESELVVDERAVKVLERVALKSRGVLGGLTGAAEGKLVEAVENPRSPAGLVMSIEEFDETDSAYIAVRTNSLDMSIRLG